MAPAGEERDFTGMRDFREDEVLRIFVFRFHILTGLFTPEERKGDNEWDAINRTITGNEASPATAETPRRPKPEPRKKSSIR